MLLGIDPSAWLETATWFIAAFLPLLLASWWSFNVLWLRDLQVCWWSMSRFEDGDGERFGMYTPNPRRFSHEDVPACSPAVMYAAEVMHLAPRINPAHRTKGPFRRRSSHTNKVRDLKYNPRTRELATLSADTSVKIWDTNHLQPVSSVFLSRECETVCIGMTEQ